MGETIYLRDGDGKSLVFLVFVQFGTIIGVSAECIGKCLCCVFCCRKIEEEDPEAGDLEIAFNSIRMPIVVVNIPQYFKYFQEAFEDCSAEGASVNNAVKDIEI